MAERLTVKFITKDKVAKSLPPVVEKVPPGARDVSRIDLKRLNAEYNHGRQMTTKHERIVMNLKRRWGLSDIVFQTQLNSNRRIIVSVKG